jgi:hypothetical protein
MESWIRSGFVHMSKWIRSGFVHMSKWIRSFELNSPKNKVFCLFLYIIWIRGVVESWIRGFVQGLANFSKKFKGAKLIIFK